MAPPTALARSSANFIRFYSHDFFHLGTVACLLLCCRRKLYPIAICAFVISGLLLRNRQNLTIFYYQAIVLVPIFATAWAGGFSVLSRMLRRRLRKRRLDLAFLGVAFLLPVTLTAIQLPTVVQAH